MVTCTVGTGDVLRAHARLRVRVRAWVEDCAVRLLVSRLMLMRLNRGRREWKTRVIAQGRAGLACKAEVRVLVSCGLKASLGQQQQEFILVAALLTARALAVSPCWFSSQSYGRWCRGSRLPCVTALACFCVARFGQAASSRHFAKMSRAIACTRGCVQWRSRRSTITA